MITRETAYVPDKRFKFSNTDANESEAGREFRIVSDDELDWLETRTVVRLPDGFTWTTAWERMRPIIT